MELNVTLEEFLKNLPETDQKLGGDTTPFYSKYETFKSYLENYLHNDVTKAAIRTEIKGTRNFNKIIWLNDHGPNHIKTVIERASHLLNNGSSIQLNAREIFFLLNAIQVHDVGNFYGRVGHESKVLEAIKTGLTPILFDRPEVIYINNIAQVHGGKVKYKDGSEDKNTILTIKEEVTSCGYPIRQQLLASILRFADELADDKSRAEIKSLNEGLIPKGSEIFHAYAACLDTVRIVHPSKEVRLHFKVPQNYLTRTFGKVVNRKQIIDRYLIDEIFERVVKMHCERIYCSKFWKHNIEIEKIWVQIEFYSNQEEGVLNLNSLLVHNEITFTLHDSEYPTGVIDIYKICPELKFKNGRKIEGASFEAELKRMTGSLKVRKRKKVKIKGSGKTKKVRKK